MDCLGIGIMSLYEGTSVKTSSHSPWRSEEEAAYPALGMHTSTLPKSGFDSIHSNILTMSESLVKSHCESNYEKSVKFVKKLHCSAETWKITRKCSKMFDSAKLQLGQLPIHMPSFVHVNLHPTEKCKMIIFLVYGLNLKITPYSVTRF